MAYLPKQGGPEEEAGEMREEAEVSVVIEPVLTADLAFPKACF